MKSAIILVLSYLIGSIPFGVVIARLKGVDLRRVGSGNIGATNVLRAMGRLPAFLALLGDFAKGIAAVFLGRVFLGDGLWQGGAGIMAIIGHNYPVFLRFKGGKGVATGFGVLSIYSPLSALITVTIWIITAVFTRYSSLASLLSYLSLPFTMAIVEGRGVRFLFSIAITIMIIWKHRENIKRLVNHMEPKIR